MKSEQKVLEEIENGISAYELLITEIPGIERKWKHLNKTMVKFLADVQEHFPDAQYYTASGGFNLMLGKSHSYETAQPQLVALCGAGTKVGDGDF